MAIRKWKRAIDYLSMKNYKTLSAELFIAGLTADINN
jgi:hypothetical protein